MLVVNFNELQGNVIFCCLKVEKIEENEKKKKIVIIGCNILQKT